MRHLTPIAALLLACGPSGAELVGTYEGILGVEPSACPMVTTGSTGVLLRVTTSTTAENFYACKTVSFEPAGGTLALKPTTCEFGYALESGSFRTVPVGLEVKARLTKAPNCTLDLAGTLTKKP